MPILSKIKIKEKVNRGELTLLSLDTNVFRRSQNNLESGIISYLSQFAESEVDIVLSDVVVEELKFHIKSSAISATEYLKKSVKEIQKAKFSNEESHLDAIHSILKSETPTSISERRVSRFLKNVNAKIIKSDEFLPAGNLLLSYFEATPPFENNEKKKNEFPDAMALHSLESYANGIQKMILAVSKDRGWKRYCERSAWLIYEDNLGTAMGYFQSLQSVAEKAILKHKDDLVENIDDELKEYVESMYIDPSVVSSEYYVGCEDVDIRYNGFRYKPDPDFTLIEHNEEKQYYVFNIYIFVDISISAILNFWISYDNVNIDIGNAEVIDDFLQLGDITITVSGNLNTDITIESIDINYVDEDFFFGDIKPE